MQDNKGERGQNPLTSHLSSSQQVLISHFHGDHAILCFVEATPPSQLKGGDAKGEANVISNLSAIQQP